MATIHSRVIQLATTHATIYDRRVRRIAAILRKCRNDGVTKKIVSEVIAGERTVSMDKTGINAHTGRRVWRRSQLDALRAVCPVVRREHGLAGADLMHAVWSCYALCGGHIPPYAGVPMQRIDHLDPRQIEVARTVNRVLGSPHYRADAINV